MLNRNYFILLLSFIALVGVFAIFNAGYQSEDGNIEEAEEIVKEDKEKPSIDKDEKEKDKAEEDNPSSDYKNEKEKPTAFQKKEEVFLDCLYVVGVPSPKAVEFSPDGKELWVASLMNERAGLYIFEVETGLKKSEVKLPDGGGVEIVFNRESVGYVSQMETGRAFKIEDGIIKKTLHSGSVWSKVLAFSPDYEKLYLSNWVGNDVSEFNSDGDLIRKIPTVRTPRGILVTENNLYVAGFANGEIQKIDLETESSEILFSTGGAMRDVVTDGKNLYFSDMAMGKIYLLTSDNEISELTETDNNPNTLKMTPDQQILVISNRGINNPESYYLPGPEWGSLLFFDLNRKKIIGSHRGGNQTTGLSLSADGKLLAYSDFLDHKVTVCNFPQNDNFSDWNINDHKKDIKK